MCKFIVTSVILFLLAAAPPVYRDRDRLDYYLDTAGREQVIKTAEDWAMRRGHILASMQLVMGDLPPDSRKVDLEVKTESERILDGGIILRKISFAAEKDDRAPAYLLIPPNLKGKTAAVLCLHQTTAIGKSEPAGLGGNPNLHYALHLAQRGYITLAPDYPNFGDYKVDAYKLGYVSGTMKGIFNHMRAVDLLCSMPEVDKDRIGCIGHSLGGHNTLFLAAFDTRIKAAVSNCGFTSFPKYYKGNLKGWCSKTYMPRIESEYNKDPAKVPFDFPEVVAAVAPRAFLAIAPMRDDNFEVSGVKDCIAAARPVFKLLNAADNLQAGYPDCAHDFPPASRKLAYEFLDKQLKAR